MRQTGQNAQDSTGNDKSNQEELIHTANASFQDARETLKPNESMSARSSLLNSSGG